MVDLEVEDDKRDDLSNNSNDLDIVNKQDQIQLNRRNDIPSKSSESFNFKTKEFNDTNLLNEINLSDLPSASHNNNR